MNKRPNVTETEDDLLEEQEKFMKSKSKPSSFVTSKYKALKKVHFQTCENENDDDDVQPDIPVLVDVVERNVNQTDIAACKIYQKELFFPRVAKLSTRQLESSSKRSLFASHAFQKRQKVEETEKETGNIWGEKSCIVDGSGVNSAETVAQEIHLENVKTLNNMTEEEILKEREELTEYLKCSDKGFELMKFIKSRRKIKSETSTNIEMNKMTIDVNDLPINPNEVKQFANMDKLEMSKLAWMTRIPETKSIETEGKSGRFDFEGNLLRRDAPIPSYQGLHHHGDEPEAPGYTLDEIFQLVRSAAVQQRVIGLKILAKIFDKAKEGVFDECLQMPILEPCLHAGLIHLLRWALDDNVQASIEAALAALNSFISNRSDEAALTRVFWWQDGHIFPFLSCQKELTDCELSELNDAQLIEIDVIQGLLRMDLLPRLHYVLSEYKLSSPAVSTIFSILTRIARHSLDSATMIVRHEYLLPLIFKHFLPKTWLGLDSNCSMPTYGLPSSEAVTLFRVLVSCGSHLAFSINQTFQLMDVVLCYVSLDLNQLDTVNRNTIMLVMESLRLWKCLLEYDIGGTHYLDLYPWIMKMLIEFEKLSVEKYQTMDVEFCTGLLSVLHSIVRLVRRGEKNTKLNWTHVLGLLQPINTCVRKWLWEMTRLNAVSDSILQLVGCAQQFLAYFYQHVTNELQFSEQVQQLCKEFLLPFWNSSVSRSLLCRLKKFSSLNETTKSGHLRDLSSLPSVGTVTWGGRTTKAIDIDSPFQFLSSFIHLIISCHNFNQPSIDQITNEILTNQMLFSYLQKLSPTGQTNWFTRFELRFIFYVVKLAFCKKNSIDESLYRASCILMEQNVNGDEFLCQQLINDVLFSPQLFDQELFVSENMANLSLCESFVLPLATKQTPHWTHSQLLDSAIKHLQLVQSVYSKIFNEILTRNWQNVVDSFGVNGGIKRILSSRWVYLPITYLHSRRNENLTNDEILNIVGPCLQYIYLFCRSNPTDFDLTECFSYISYIFMLGSDLFLQESIHSYLLAILLILLNDTRWEKCDSIKQPLNKSSSSFRDFYVEFLNQFEAVSYSDSLFSLFVLIPIQQKFDVRFRIDLWSEHSAVIRYLNIPIDKIAIPLENYLEPLERNEQLLSFYCGSLLGGVVTPRNPLPYLIALHHVHHFLFDDDDELITEQKRRIVKKLSSTKIKDLFAHLTLYDKPNARSGFELHKEQSAHVQKVLEKYKRE